MFRVYYFFLFLNGKTTRLLLFHKSISGAETLGPAQEFQWLLRVLDPFKVYNNAQEREREREKEGG
jgi:hypothetical protein